MSILRLAAFVFGAAFIAAGILGFIPNPIVHSEGLFVTNTIHNLVHVFTGALFLLATKFQGKEYAVIIAIGVGYILVSILGYLTSGDYLLGVIHINQADRWLHLFLAVAILLAGKIAKSMDARNTAHAN